MVTTLVLDYCTARHNGGHWSDGTLTTNRYRLLEFAATVTHLRPDQLTRRHAERWLQQPGLAASTHRGRLTTLRGFARWGEDRGRMRDITKGLEPPPVRQLPPRNLTAEQVAATLHACPDNRARLCVILAVQEGLRRSEIAALEWGDIDRDTIRVRGKGGRGSVTRVLPLSDQSRHAIDAYRAEVGAVAGPLVRHATRPHCGVSGQLVGRIITEAMSEAGVKQGPRDGVSAHALRHTMAEDLLVRGADIREVQHALGHQSMQSTQVYLRARPEGLRDVMAGRRYG